MEINEFENKKYGNSIKPKADLFKNYKKVKTNLPILGMKEEISLWI